MQKLLRRLFSRPEVWVLTFLAAVTRLWGLFSPNVVVFDEVYFKVYAGNYLNGAYYFDPHPPLGKLLLGGAAYLLGLPANQVVSSTDPTVLLRLLPAIAGILIIPVVYLILRQLRASRKVAALGALLLLLDNALLVESRFILTDSLLILFSLGAISAYLAARRRTGRPRSLYLLATGLLAGCTVSVKWTGIATLGLIGLAWFIESPKLRDAWRRLAGETILLVAVPAVVYLSVFAVHFSLLPHSGQGDAFMSPKFQSLLKGSSYYQPNATMSLEDRFIDLNRAMRDSEEGLKTATHPYGSKWYTWPVMQRPVYYYQGPTDNQGNQGNIYLLGNPVVWWGVLVAIFALLFNWPTTKRRLGSHRLIFLFLITGYVSSFLPFSQIVRVMFLYHYLIPFIFSLMIAVLGVGLWAGWNDDDQGFWHFNSQASRWLYLGIVAAAVLGFVYFAPLSYGTPLSPSAIQQHMWLPTWR